MRFEGQLAVVTGANSGIGRATAIRLLEEGATVVAVKLEHSDPWPPLLVGRVDTVVADVADPATPGAVVALPAVTTGRWAFSSTLRASFVSLRFFDTQRSEGDRVLAVNPAGVSFSRRLCAVVWSNRRPRAVSSTSPRCTPWSRSR
jgi:NAD(P)-dependent dehydrogenase (short-subunit alcohol dehydrogenase family)